MFWSEREKISSNLVINDDGHFPIKYFSRNKKKKIVSLRYFSVTHSKRMTYFLSFLFLPPKNSISYLYRKIFICAHHIVIFYYESCSLAIHYGFLENGGHEGQKLFVCELLFFIVSTWMGTGEWSIKGGKYLMIADMTTLIFFFFVQITSLTLTLAYLSFISFRGRRRFKCIRFI